MTRLNAKTMKDIIEIVSIYGDPQMVSDGEGEIFIYAQTSQILGTDGFFPVHTEGFANDRDLVEEVIEKARRKGMNVRFDPEYLDAYSGDTLTAFVFQP